MLPIHCLTLTPSMAPSCPWDKVLSSAWHSQTLPPHKPHYSLSPTLKIVQPLRTHTRHPTVALFAIPSTWNPCPPLLLATSFSSFKPSASIPSSRQPSQLLPVLPLAEASLGPQHHPAKGQASRQCHTQGQLGTFSFPGDGQ